LGFEKKNNINKLHVVTGGVVADSKTAKDKEGYMLQIYEAMEKKRIVKKPLSCC